MRRGAPIAVGAAALAGGCMKGREFSAVKARVDEMRQDFGAVQTKLSAETRVSTGGGAFNEPVTGWIMAAGYASVPATIFLYLLAHRFRIFRRMKDRIRGAPA